MRPFRIPRLDMRDMSLENSSQLPRYVFDCTLTIHLDNSLKYYHYIILWTLQCQQPHVSTSRVSFCFSKLIHRSYYITVSFSVGRQNKLPKSRNCSPYHSSRCYYECCRRGPQQQQTVILAPYDFHFCDSFKADYIIFANI